MEDKPESPPESTPDKLQWHDRETDVVSIEDQEALVPVEARRDTAGGGYFAGGIFGVWFAKRKREKERRRQQELADELARKRQPPASPDQ